MAVHVRSKSQMRFTDWLKKPKILPKRLIKVTLIIVSLIYIASSLHPQKPKLSSEDFLRNFESSDELSKDEQIIKTRILENQNNFLTTSIPKSGTTVLSWITRAAFSHIFDALPKEGEGAYKLENMPKHNRITLDSMTIVFSFHFKHHARIYSGFQNTLSKRYSSFNFDLDFEVKKYIPQIIKMSSKQANNSIVSLLSNDQDFTDQANRLAKMPFFGKKKFAKRHFTMFRDPLAVIVSYKKYMRPNITTKRLNSEVLSECESKVVETAIGYYLVTEVFPSKGYDFYPLFFEHLREDPHKFIAEFLLQMGLTDVPDFIVDKVVHDTNPGHMKQIQEEMTKHEIDEDEIKHGQFGGLSSRGKNSRKVRKAEVKGYVKELSPEVLSVCTEHAKRHLPLKLLDIFGFR